MNLHSIKLSKTSTGFSGYAGFLPFVNILAVPKSSMYMQKAALGLRDSVCQRIITMCNHSSESSGY